MMAHPTHPLRAGPHVLVVMAAALAMAAPVPPAVAATARYDAQPSLVRCTPVRLPVPHAGPGMVRRIQADRFFAPTRQAVFFFRAGDRCTWHGPHLARG